MKTIMILWNLHSLRAQFIKLINHRAKWNDRWIWTHSTKINYKSHTQAHTFTSREFVVTSTHTHTHWVDPCISLELNGAQNFKWNIAIAINVYFCTCKLSRLIYYVFWRRRRRKNKVNGKLWAHTCVYCAPS